MARRLKFVTMIFACSCLLNAGDSYSQETTSHRSSFLRSTLPLYPAVLDTLPNIDSPFTTEEEQELLLVTMKSNQYALIPVTIENGAPLHYSTRVKSVLGKDQQLLVDTGDFPTLSKTGLHSESELRGKEMITGFPVSLITYIGRPGRFSGAGFMADDEDVTSVLIGDNRLVEKMGLTHPQMAKPLFHVWNVILKEYELGNWARHWDNIPSFFYNGAEVMLKAHGTKGWQISIFQDEVQGSCDIDVGREMTEEEKSFLKDEYPALSPDQLTELEKKLSSIHFSEMVPYYIMRYGFYEGHTDYRSDPIAVAFIFGLKSLEEIENVFQGELYQAMMNHYTNETIGR
jgi:hypothetical protein